MYCKFVLLFVLMGGLVVSLLQYKAHKKSGRIFAELHRVNYSTK
jgi:hypothetical protein